MSRTPLTFRPSPYPRSVGFTFPFDLGSDQAREQYIAKVTALRARMRAQGHRFCVAPGVRLRGAEHFLDEGAPVRPTDFDWSELGALVQSGEVLEEWAPPPEDKHDPPEAA